MLSEKRSKWMSYAGTALLTVAVSGCSMIPGLGGKAKLPSSSSPSSSASSDSAAASGGATAAGPSANADEKAYIDWPRESYEGRALASLSPWEKGLFLAEQLRFGEAPLPRGAWWMDLTGDVSMTQRLIYVAACLKADPGDVKSVAIWSLCADDARALDRQVLERELKGVDEELAHDVLAHLAWAQRNAQARQATVDALAAADPAIAELAVTLPKQARAAWAAAVKDSGSRVADALKVIDAGRTGSKKVLAACDGMLWPHVAEFVKGHADLGPQLDVLGEMAHEPTGSLLAHAMSVCFKTDATGSDRQGPWAGARVAVLQAIWRNQIEFDQQDRSAQNIHELAWVEWPQPGPAHTSWMRRERGVIASVAPGADGVTVTFKSTKVKFEKCLASRETDKIDTIEDGHIVYRTVCTKWGWETTTDTVEPAVIRTRFAAELEAGRYLEIVRDEMGVIPVTVHKTAEATSPVVARSGVAL